MGSRQTLTKISIIERALLPWHTIKNKTKALYFTWGKVKKGERNFVYLWMALLKSQYPKQSQQTCCAALGHDLTLWSAPKLSQPDISNGKKPRAETEQRERECHASAHSPWSKNTLSDLWHNTDYDLQETLKILLPSRDTSFAATKTDVLSDDTDKLLAFRQSGVTVTQKHNLFSPQGLIRLPKYCNKWHSVFAKHFLSDTKQQMVYCLCSKYGHFGVPSGSWLGHTASSCIHCGSVSNVLLMIPGCFFSLILLPHLLLLQGRYLEVSIRTSYN